MQESLPRRSGLRRLLAVGLTLLLLGLALVVATRRRGVESSGARVTAEVPVLGPYAMTIVPGVHLLGGLAPAAAYVVETSEGLVLIDTGLDKSAGLLRDQMASLGLDWKRIRAILLTHVHGDHTGGAQYLRAATGAKVYAGREDAAVLRAGTPHVAFFSIYSMPPDVTAQPTTVDEELTDGQVITVGDTRFQVLATPGHTPGSICYLLERGEQRILFSGDVIMSLVGNPQSTTLRGGALGTYSAYLAPQYRGDAAAFLATLRRLRGLPAPELVLPGHPRRDPAPPSPSMTQERWQAILDRGIDEMVQLQARFAADGYNFLDGTPKQLLPDLYYLGDFKDVAVYGLFAGPRFFLVDAPGGPGLREFLNARLAQVGRMPTALAAVLLTSANKEETAGLPSLLAHDPCTVVAPRAAWEQFKTISPAATRFVPAEDVPGQGWFPVTPLVLHGRGLAPCAYLVHWSGKRVLFSGRIPIRITQETRQGLLQDFERGQLSVPEYRATLRQLSELKPDLWLPAFPVNGQNANLYESEWESVLSQNALLFR
jgi:glyoxylase-like metal-dependent hydrolase (beta-lactamase superfamily II)